MEYSPGFNLVKSNVKVDVIVSKRNSDSTESTNTVMDFLFIPELSFRLKSKTASSRLVTISMAEEKGGIKNAKSSR